MQYIELDKKEEEISKAFDQGRFKSVDNFKIQKSAYQKYAKATLGKAKNINIRLSEKDLQKVKSKAISKGIPYQTLLTSLIHQYAEGKLGKKI